MFIFLMKTWNGLLKIGWVHIGPETGWSRFVSFVSVTFSFTRLISRLAISTQYNHLVAMRPGLPVLALFDELALFKFVTGWYSKRYLALKCFNTIVSTITRIFLYEFCAGIFGIKKHSVFGLPPRNGLRTEKSGSSRNLMAEISMIELPCLAAFTTRLFLFEFIVLKSPVLHGAWLARRFVLLGSVQDDSFSSLFQARSRKTWHLDWPLLNDPATHHSASGLFHW